VLIYREAAEGARYRTGRCRGTEIPEMGRGGAPLPIFLMLNLLDAERLFCPSIWAL